ncbi:unnamed protein product [Onchocerca flexuosa]|uniref:Ovule protein n=1 Tax=Onchocerca flexuosa TaxID=387005 RepID=A0A183HNP2_9BILA|nr:unnamed protein product [Onchocerca flexuosa]
MLEQLVPHKSSTRGLFSRLSILPVTFPTPNVTFLPLLKVSISHSMAKSLSKEKNVKLQNFSQNYQNVSVNFN